MRLRPRQLSFSWCRTPDYQSNREAGKTFRRALQTIARDTDVGELQAELTARFGGGEHLGTGVNRITYSLGQRFVLKLEREEPSHDNANLDEYKEAARLPKDMIAAIILYDKKSRILIQERADTNTKALLPHSFHFGVNEDCHVSHESAQKNCPACRLSVIPDAHEGNVGVIRGRLVCFDLVGY